ncbi:MAG: hypothetical protein U9Q83_07550, partial [Bacteroidota bacterium]|nr:hypothetical protein [Bacteroidota bacterium]
MRKIDKDYKNIPEILSSERAEKHLQKIISKEEKSNAQGAIYRHDDVLNKLDSLYFKKCGYCEKITNNYEIEHYRPKDKELYPYLSYEWSNIFPVCHHCNFHKKNLFPISSKVRNSDINIRDIKILNEIEEPKIINPEIDNPEEHFDFNIETGEIIGKTSRANETIKICDLNSDDLIYFRKKTIDPIIDTIENINISTEVVSCNFFETIIKKIIINKRKNKEFSMFWQ